MIHSRTVFVSPAAKAILTNIAPKCVRLEDGAIGANQLRCLTEDEAKVLRDSGIVAVGQDNGSYNVFVNTAIVQQLGLRSCAKEQ